MAINSISSSPIRKSIDGRIFIPGVQNKPIRKIELTIDSILTDISDYVLSVSVSPNADVQSWSANIILNNKDGYFVDKLIEDAIIKIYYDFNNASTQQFEGVVKTYTFNLTSNGRIAKLVCFDYMFDLQTTYVWENYTSEQTGDYIIKDLIDKYTTGFTYSNIDSITDTLAPNFVGQSLVECFRTIAEYCGCYLFLQGSTFKDFYFFKKTGTGRLNTTEYIAYAMNLIDVTNIYDSTGIRNKLYASGARIDGLLNLTTVSIDDGLKAAIYNDNSAYTSNQLIIKSTQKLNNISTIKNIGSGKCIGLVNQIPGYEINIDSPYDKISGLKDIISFTTTLNSSGLITTFNFTNRPNDLSSTILQLSDKAKEAILDIEENGMHYSINYTFNSSSDIDSSSTNVTNVTSDNNEKTELAVITGSTGTWISPSTTLSFNPTQCMIKTNSDYQTDNCLFYVRFVPGVWESINLKEIHTITNIGKYPQVKVIMTNDATDRIPRFDSVALLYK